jgi:hypothetical protein
MPETTGISGHQNASTPRPRGWRLRWPVARTPSGRVISNDECYRMLEAICAAVAASLTDSGPDGGPPTRPGSPAPGADGGRVLAADDVTQSEAVLVAEAWRGLATLESRVAVIEQGIIQACQAANWPVPDGRLRQYDKRLGHYDKALTIIGANAQEPGRARLHVVDRAAAGNAQGDERAVHPA